MLGPVSFRFLQAEADFWVLVKDHGEEEKSETMANRYADAVALSASVSKTHIKISRGLYPLQITSCERGELRPQWPPPRRDPRRQKNPEAELEPGQIQMPTGWLVRRDPLASLTVNPWVTRW